MAPTRRPLLSALLAALVALPACGSDETASDYVDEVNRLQNELVNEVTETVSGTPPADPEAAARIAADLRRVFEASADDLEAIEPPDDVAELHGRLVAAVRDVGSRIADAEEEFEGGTARRATRAARELQRATTDLQAKLNGVIEQINAELPQ